MCVCVCVHRLLEVTMTHGRRVLHSQIAFHGTRNYECIPPTSHWQHRNVVKRAPCRRWVAIVRIAHSMLCGNPHRS